MLSLEYVLNTFIDTLFGHVSLAVYLFAIMGERNWRRIKKLPALLLSPMLAALLWVVLHTAFPSAWVVRYCVNSCAVLLMCTLWAQWAWRSGFWQAFAAVCMGGIFQVAVSCLSRMLSMTYPSVIPSRFAVVLAIHMGITAGTAALLYRLRFGFFFQRLLENVAGQLQTTLLLFALEAAMEAFLVLQEGVQPEYLVPYYLLVLVMVALTVGLVIYLAQRLDAAQKLEAQRVVIAQQQLYEQDLEAIRREVRSFRHDYKNLLAGMSEQADQGELDQLRTTLSELDAGFDRRIGEKIRASAQIGNLRIPQVRSLLLTKLAHMREKGIDCRLEVLYPVEQAGMDVWDFARCFGILLDNAAEAALETEAPWVEIILLAQEGGLFLRVSNPYAGAIDPDMIWAEGFSTKGEGRGLGLSGYQRILAGCPNVTASTSWAGGVFVQELTVEGWL